jgi:hypothetical protein
MQQYRAKINRKQTFFEIDSTVACPKLLVIDPPPLSLSSCILDEAK